MGIDTKFSNALIFLYQFLVSHIRSGLAASPNQKCFLVIFRIRGGLRLIGTWSLKKISISING